MLDSNQQVGYWYITIEKPVETTTLFYKSAEPLGNSKF